MNTIRRMIILIMLSVTLISAAHAQFIASPYEIGFNIGTLIYQGDLAASKLGYTKSLHPAIGLQASKTMNDFFSLRSALALGSIAAYDSAYTSPAWRKYRDLKFHSPVIELSAVGEFYFLGDAKVDRPGHFSPYVFAGVGFTFLHIKRDWTGFDATYFGEGSSTITGLERDIAHRVPWVIPVIPVGFGVRYTITQHFSLRAEFTYRLTATDYLDGFKYAGDPARNDRYYGISIGISYRFGQNRLNCPKRPS